MNRPQKSIRIVITIETRIYREGIAQLLARFDDIEIIGTASSLPESVEICSTASPDVLLMDAHLNDTLSTIRLLKKEKCNLKIILLSMVACRNQMSKFAGEGVLEFITYDDSIKDLYQSIKAAMKNGFWCSSRVAKLLLEQSTSSYEAKNILVDSTLTRQQVNVLQQLELGISNKEIGRKLHIETATVKNHVHHILQKLQVHSRGEAAVVYRKLYGLY